MNSNPELISEKLFESEEHFHQATLLRHAEEVDGKLPTPAWSTAYGDFMTLFLGLFLALVAVQELNSVQSHADLVANAKSSMVQLNESLRSDLVVKQTALERLQKQIDQQRQELAVLNAELTTKDTKISKLSSELQTKRRPAHKSKNK